MRAARERRRAELVGARMLGPAVRELDFVVREGSPVAFAPGQYVNLHLAGRSDAPLARSYSMAAAPRADGRLRFAVTRVEGGPGSEALHGLPVGAELELDGPWGVFTLDRAPEDAPLLFVATGTGLTPIRAMLEAELASGRERRVGLLFGCRTEADRLWPEELAEWAAAHERLAIWTTLSKGSEAREGRRGWVQGHLAAALAELGGEPHAFVCGLRAMIDAVRAALKETHGFDRKRIHTERYD